MKPYFITYVYTRADSSVAMGFRYYVAESKEYALGATCLALRKKWPTQTIQLIDAVEVQDNLIIGKYTVTTKISLTGEV